MMHFKVDFKNSSTCNLTNENYFIITDFHIDIYTYLYEFIICGFITFFYIYSLWCCNNFIKFKSETVWKITVVIIVMFSLSGITSINTLLYSIPGFCFYHFLRNILKNQKYLCAQTMLIH